MIFNLSFHLVLLFRIVRRLNKQREVKLIRSKLICECQDDVYLGIPCRHQIAVFIKARCALKYLSFNKRWTISFYKDEIAADPENIEERQDPPNNVNVISFSLKLKLIHIYRYQFPTLLMLLLLVDRQRKN